MNTANILNPRTPAVQAPTTRAAELYPLVLTPRILNSRGISARHIRVMVAAGTLQRIQRGAYIYTRDAQALAPDERLAVRCIAAHLMGLQGVFSHTSAAALWGLDVLNAPSIVHVYSTATSSSDRGRICRHRRGFDPNAVTAIPGTPVIATTVARTLQDCARSMPFREAVVLADSIMRRGLMEPREVTEILLNLAGYGSSAGPLLAQAVDASSESAGESLARCLLMEHELPTPMTQYPISCEGRNYRVDFAWPEARVILEFDGEQKYVDHPGRDRSEAARDRALTRAGWTVVHLTWADIFQKEREVIVHLRGLLMR